MVGRYGSEGKTGLGKLNTLVRLLYCWLLYITLAQVLKLLVLYNALARALELLLALYFPHSCNKNYFQFLYPSIVATPPTLYILSSTSMENYLSNVVH